MKRRITNIIGFCAIAAVLILILFVTLVHLGAFGALPTHLELQRIKHSEASTIISSDDKILGRYYYQNRTNLGIEEVPQHFIDALVATEDVRFFEHNGIDRRSTMRVLVKSILLFNKRAGGGSTITQQLAKNLYPRKRHGILTMPVAKAKEIITAKRIEDNYTKNEILELYLNTVSFGENTFGLETASITYFNKETSRLTLEESAILVGLLKANFSYNPRLNRNASIKRRNVVLHQMARYGYITQELSDSLQKLDLKLHYTPLKHDVGLAPYYREYVRKQAEEIVSGILRSDGSPYNIYADGLKIKVSLNAKMQQYAEEVMRQHMFRLQKTFDEHWRNREPWKKDIKYISRQLHQLEAYKLWRDKGLSEEETIAKLKQTHKTKVFTLSGEQEREISTLDSLYHHFRYLQNGFLVINAHSGEVLVWIGGINYKYFKYDHVLSKRQVGSTFKPIVYATAIENGISPCTFYNNDSVVYEEYNNWCPANADKKYGGSYSLKGALANSINTVSVSVLMQQGIQNAIQTAQRMGITVDLPAVPSLALGTAEISLFEMVYAYSSFMNKGLHANPVTIKSIANAQGKIIYTSKTRHSSQPAFSETTAATMLEMMKGTVSRGTASNLRNVYGLKSDIAAKTGTTAQHTDGWFIACTPDLIAGSWVGGDSPIVRFRSLTFGQGSYTAMPVFARWMQKIEHDSKYSNLSQSRFNIPFDIIDTFECEDFREKEITETEKILKKPIDDFIKNLFKRKDKEKRKDKKRNKES